MYSLTDTRLIREAEAMGLQTIGGLDMLVAQAHAQFQWWTNVRPPSGVMRTAALKAVGFRSFRPMNTTSFEEFKELARHGTFVPVVKEVVADLVTPVSAFLKIAEDADYAFLLVAGVEGGEHVARYSFPRQVIRFSSSAPATAAPTIERSSGVDQREQHDIHRHAARAGGGLPDRRSMQDLPRFTGGALRCGFLGYGASSWVRAGGGARRSRQRGVDDLADDAGFMLYFDTVLAFDHVQHRILIIANAPDHRGR